MNELVPTPDDADTDDVLRALDTDVLTLAEEPGAAHGRRGNKDEGYDPYDTARIKVGDRFKRR